MTASGKINLVDYLVSLVFQNNFVSCNESRIPESKKFVLVESRIWENLLVESGILGFGIQNTAQGIRNPSKDLNPESKCH